MTWLLRGSPSSGNATAHQPGAVPQFTAIAATGDLPIEIDEIPLAEVDAAWHRGGSSGRRTAFRP